MMSVLISGANSFGTAAKMCNAPDRPALQKPQMQAFVFKDTL
jgi:hypothetical protein